MAFDGSLAFGVCVGPSDKYDRLAQPGILAVDPEAVVLLRQGQSSIHEAYNSLIEEARSLHVAALVLLHDDLVIADLAFVDKIGALLAQPNCGVIGAIGAVNVESIDWWWYEGHGRVDQIGQPADFGRGVYSVDTVDGVLMVLSPAALEVIRLVPDQYPGFHGYDAEMCSQVRAAGLSVTVADLDVFHAKPPLELRDEEVHASADRAWRRRWRRGLRHEVRYRLALIEHDRIRSRKQKLKRLLKP